MLGKCDPHGYVEGNINVTSRLEERCFKTITRRDELEFVKCAIQSGVDMLEVHVRTMKVLENIVVCCGQHSDVVSLSREKRVNIEPYQ